MGRAPLYFVLAPRGRLWYNVDRMGGAETPVASAARPFVVKVRVSETEKRWLGEIAAAQDRTVSQVLRLALRDYYRNHIR